MPQEPTEAERQTIAKYADIIHLPHYQSKHHKPMDPLSRAAQFGAFAAVAGHYEALKERARYTEQWKPLEEDQREQLDRVFNLLRIHQQTHPIIKIEYFVPDTLKKGGAYKTNTERLQKLDEQKHKIILQDGTEIPISHISEMNIIDPEIFE